MAREAPGYRENLADILEFTGGKRLLTLKLKGTVKGGAT